MKIGILTLPLHNNYGGILQNFALHEYLKGLGHDIYTINFQYKKRSYSTSRLLLSCIKRLFLKLIGNEKILFINPQIQTTFSNTLGIYQKRFIAQNIKQIEVQESIGQDFENQYNFDVYIVGSDQVWRPAFSPFLTNYYLDFATNNRTKKIAYAASFGVDIWEADKNITPHLSNYAKKFNAISVREDSGIKLCIKHLGIQSIQTIDPTMLINPDVYRNIVKNASEDFYIGKNKACVYILDMNKEKQSIINTICKSKQLQIHRVGKPNKNGFPSIESWINGFDKAEFVITDSFHGTVFAILFNKPFISIGNEGRGLTRFSSLLSMFELTSRFVFKTEKIESIKEKIEFDVDYDFVNKILSNQRILSETFLLNAINI